MLIQLSWTFIPSMIARLSGPLLWITLPHICIMPLDVLDPIRSHVDYYVALNRTLQNRGFTLAANADHPGLTPDEAMAALTELFSDLPNSSNFNSRRYILALEAGEPVFRRDDICLALENAVNEILGLLPNKDRDDIVPQKLSKLFSGRRQPQGV